MYDLYHFFSFGKWEESLEVGILISVNAQPPISNGDVHRPPVVILYQR